MMVTGSVARCFKCVVGECGGGEGGGGWSGGGWERQQVVGGGYQKMSSHVE